VVDAVDAVAAVAAVAVVGEADCPRPRPS
jgi:hypothetical protein